jgi:hypothetical protein
MWAQPMEASMFGRLHILSLYERSIVLEDHPPYHGRIKSNPEHDL